MDRRLTVFCRSVGYTNRLHANIAEKLKTQPYCVVSLLEMERVWPNAKTRKENMVNFAKENQWRLYYYDRDYIAIFDNELLLDTR